MKKIILLLALTVSFVVFAGEKYSREYLDNQAKQIMAEANELYLLERGAWVGTDMLSEKFPKQVKNLGGYVTYLSDNNTITSVFYTKDPVPMTIAVFTFDIHARLRDAKIDSKERKLTKLENELRLIRESVYKEMKNTSFYQFYSNTSPNIIPIIKNNEKKAYILTGPSLDNILIMGNDFLLTFNDDYTLKNTEAFHNSMVVQNTALPEMKDAVSAVHTHVKGKSEFITPTDLCTLRLYASMLNLESYSVISADYISVWDFKKNTLTISSIEDWKKKYNLK
ncbi:hypothetical protein [Sebaldella sp. S0638]|uniref:hypothetical protein n=1 Tax=Sebaldella sp. S0638 TaxID=2957809 RepID=UPI00209EE9B8|nr:hypothetical protein [Sebaldella sp. S0638]MCP1224464.1 hypothetical protein [Sebaldella sp. S0638]